jgi:hypothetical protein
MHNQRKDSPHSTLAHAVETLSSIVDFDMDRQYAVAEEQELHLHGHKIEYKSVRWLGKNKEESQRVIKNIFKVVLRYLKRFYKHEYSYVENKNAMDEIKTIMVLVGEAAKKLDMGPQTSENVKKITELSEYKALQVFYKERIAKKIDEGTLGKWILSIVQSEQELQESKKAVKKEDLSSKEFISLQGVKRDLDYELFYMRKDNGSRFYTPRVVRNMKLVSDFSSYFGPNQVRGELIHLGFAKDAYYCTMANHLLDSMGSKMRNFFAISVLKRRNEFFKELNFSLIALMLSSHKGNRKENNPIKTCEAYFKDFQFFLRKCLSSKIYQKLVAYKEKSIASDEQIAFDLCQSICFCMNKSLDGFRSFDNYMERVLEEALQMKEFVEFEYDKTHYWKKLLDSYMSMTSLVKHNLKGPVHKILSVMESKENNAFDPFIQGNLPNYLLGLYYNEKKIDFLHMPSPTHQEKIHQATVTEEFLAYLREGKKNRDKTTHLLFNFQDNTDWKEFARSKALEDIAKAARYKEQIEVVTLPKNTAFYHQIEPYHKENQAEIFINHLKEQIVGKSTGFYFSKKIEEKLFPQWIEHLLLFVHRAFYGEKNVLMKEDRLSFIEICYTFIELKIIQEVHPQCVSMTCKDGIDKSSTALLQLYLLLTIARGDLLSEKDYNHLWRILYLPSILVRERLVLPEYFYRFLNTIKKLESIQEEYGKQGLTKIINEGWQMHGEAGILNALIVD